MKRSDAVIFSSIIAIGLVAAPAAVQAAIAGSVTVSGTGTATCPSGYRVSGGGFELPQDYYAPSGNQYTIYKIRYSRPSGSNKWQASADKTYTDGGGTPRTFPYGIKVYATCVK